MKLLTISWLHVQSYLLRLILGAIFAVSFIGSFLKQWFDIVSNLQGVVNEKYYKRMDISRQSVL